MNRFLFLLILFLTTVGSLNAQLLPDSNKNEIKVNLSALLLRNISLQYERKITRKMSVALGAHVLPFGKLPFKNTIRDIADLQNVNFDELKIGGFGFAPEVRFYTGKKGVFHGFYLGPFLNFSSYKAGLPIYYNDKTGIFNGHIFTKTLGLQLGIQTNISKNVRIDFWLLGPQYGASSGELVFKGTLDEVEQSALRFSIQDVKDDSPIRFIDSYNVDQKGGNIEVKGPWAGLRGAGINLALTF